MHSGRLTPGRSPLGTCRPPSRERRYPSRTVGGRPKLTTIIPLVGRDVPYMTEQLESLERAFQSRPDVEVRFVDAARPQHELAGTRPP